MQKAEGGQQIHYTIHWVACFLVQMFMSKRAALHIKIGSQELWPFFLHCLGQRLQSACQESPLEALLMHERIKQLLNKMKSLTSDYLYTKLLGHDFGNSWTPTQYDKDKEELLRSIDVVLRDTAGVEIEAKREAAKISAKRAPWEKGGTAEQADNDTLP